MFRTELPIAPATDQLSRTARVLTMGSCFADSIGSRLLNNKVEALVNPFGTVFQPLALARLLRAAAGEEVDWQQHVVEARGRWQSYDLHGSIGAGSPVELLQHIQELVRRTGEFLRNSDVVLLTLGTAWAYRLRETGELVNNCHKQPADLFVRELLTPDEIINALAETHAYLRRINPKLRFVLTVSPVRHLKDTLPLNAVSKSVLRVATHIVSDLLPGVAYFPAYELLVDDLRDYRFYAADMLHPSEVAEEYIWDKFARTYFDADFGRFRKEWAGVRQSLGHRPLHAGAPEHRAFLEGTLSKLEQLSLRRVEVTDELQTVRTLLAALPEPRRPEPLAEVEDDEERIDIGEGAAVSTAGRLPDAAPATAGAEPQALVPTPARPPRLSPEEFRSQRANRSGRPEQGRRDGRGKGQQALPSENEQFQTAEFQNATLPAVAAELLSEEAFIEQNAAPIASLGGEADGPEHIKKKKRRSRGGAKRTARKQALRLAAELGQELAVAPAKPEGGVEAVAATGEVLSAPEAQPEVKKSSVIVKSVPVKRGGRRNEAGRVPRVPLFAAPGGEAESLELPVQAEDAESPSLLPTETVATLAIVETEVEASSETAAASPSRTSRNRKKKKAGPRDAATPALAATPDQPLGTAEPRADTPEAVAPSEPVGPALAVAALPVEASATTVQTSGPAPEGVTPPVAAPRRSNRAKRVVSGARTEKPAVDTPVVPVPDPAQVRTQVAAGRMMGSSASLVAPDAKPKKAAAKTSAAQKPTPASAEAPKATKKPAVSRSKAPKTAQETVAAPPTPEDALPQVPPAPPQAKAAIPKAAAKPKPAAPKASAAKPKAAKPKAPKKPKNPA
jgi:hypothetical protein